jgi:hypothetical protein
MNKLGWLLAGSIAVAAMAAGCETHPTGGGSATDTPPPTASATTTAPASASVTATTTATEPTASTTASAEPVASGSSTATPAQSSSAESKYDCGGKGQKACPMQGWMKGVMASAVASGDAAKIAAGLNTIASKPVAGFGEWSGIAAAGAAKASAGDIDGAKEACKKCHALYQKKYKETMRDRPW